MRQARKETPWLYSFRARRNKANKLGLPFSLTNEWAAERWTGKCEVTGIPFDLTNPNGRFFSPSIDRKDPTLGYIPGNCRFVLFAVNALKGTGTDADMLTVAKAIIEAQSAIYQAAPPSP